MICTCCEIFDLANKKKLYSKHAGKTYFFQNLLFSCKVVMLTYRVQLHLNFHCFLIFCIQKRQSCLQHCLSSAWTRRELKSCTGSPVGVSPRRGPAASPRNLPSLQSGSIVLELVSALVDVEPLGRDDLHARLLDDLFRTRPWP